MKPRILFVSHDSGRTGAPIGLLAFMQWLRSAGYEFATVLAVGGALETDFRKLGPTLTLGTSRWQRSKFARRLLWRVPAQLRPESRALRRFVTRFKPDVIYANTMTNGALLELLAPHQIPVLTHAHELEYWIHRAGPENLRQTLRHTAAFIAASGAVRDNLVEHHGVDRARVTVVYEHIRELPALPAEGARLRARQDLGIPPDALVVGSCGAEHWRKGRDLIPLLLLALRRSHAERSCHFVWLGRPGASEEEFALHHDLNHAGVKSQFHSSGEVSDPLRLYPAMDVFALLSRDDPYPLACLEAAALAIPVICFSNAGGMPEFVRDGCGLAAPYLDIDAVAQHILQLARQPEVARQYGLAGRAKVAAENLPGQTGPKLLATIHDVAKKPCENRLP